MNRLTAFIVVALIGLPLIVSAQKQELKFKHINSNDGLSHSFVRKIIQDHEGYMWFVTANGLNKYDGYKMTVYKNVPGNERSLPSNDVWEVFEDRENNLWVGTSRGISLYNREKDDFTYQHSLGEKFTNFIYEDRDHDIWATTRTEIFRLDKSNNSFGKIAPKGYHGEVSSLYKDTKGNFWIAGFDGVFLLDKKQNVAVQQTQIKMKFVNSFCEDKKGNFWMGSREEGFLKYNREKKTSIHYQNDSKNANSILSNHVLCLKENVDGKIWIGTENGGLSVFDPDKNIFNNYSNDEVDLESLSFNSVYSICIDQNKNTWLGTFAGVEFVKSGKFRHIRRKILDKNSISSNNVLCFFEDSKGKIWIGTDGGGLNCWDRQKGEYTHYKHDPNNPKSLSSDAVTYLREDKQGNLWVGMWAGGMDLFDRNKNEFIHHMKDEKNLSSSLFDNNVVNIYEDSKSNLWVGTLKGVASYDRNTNKFSHFTPQGTDIMSYIGDIMEDRDNNLWVGTFDGLSVIDGRTGKGTFLPHKANDNKTISSDVINTLFQDSKGNIWVGTLGGLNLYNQTTKSFTLFSQKDGLPSDAVYGILEDKNHNLWISTANGLCKFNPETKVFRSFNMSDGLQANEFKENAFIKLRSGEMLFGGPNGFNIFNPDKIKDNSLIPPVVITDFKIFNKSIPLNEKGSPLKNHISQTKEIILSYKQSVFSFDYSALNFLSPERNQYAYKLEGLEKDWNYVGNKRSTTYTNLDPGKYTFKLKASNNDGIWNEQGTFLLITVLPPFWLTWWFKSIVLFSVVGFAFTFYKVRINAIKAQKIALETQVQERTLEVVQQKEELSAQADNLMIANQELQEKQEEILQQTEEILQQREHIEAQRDVLEATNNKVMSSLEYAKNIQSAILPSTTKIGRSIPDHFILYRPKDVVSGDFYWFTHLPKEELDGHPVDVTIIACIDCTGHGVPGAFMSIIGNTVLNEIVNLKHIIDPAEILENLDQGVKRSVEKTDGVNTASMDVCLMRIERSMDGKIRVLYGGAKRPLFYVENNNNTLQIIDGDRRSIGSYVADLKPFVTKEIFVEEGTRFYLTTDGYADQNNVDRAKLGSPKVKETILSVIEIPMTAQKEVFEKVLEDHQQDSEQRDDITLLGIQV